MTDFGRWTLPRSEAPETFIFWTGLFTIASALRRHVKIPKTLLGSWEASPNLYILFIAKAGRARKSTTANYTEELIDMLGEDITKSPELITKESLLSTLAKAKDVSMCIVAPEFGEFMVKSGPEMYGFLTNAYDGKKKLSSSTLSRGVELAERPCVNLLGATTPEWVAANMPASVIGGGFASRVVFINEKYVRRRQLFYDQLDFAALEILRLNLIADLDHIARNLHGDFEITVEAKEWMEKWYQDNAEAPVDSDSALDGYYERKPAHILKIAMIIHISYSDELMLTVKDFKEAVLILNQIEKRLPDTFQSLGRNPYSADTKNMVEWIKQKGRVSERELKRKFYNIAARPEDLNGMIKGLVDIGSLSVIVDVSQPEKERRFFIVGPAEGDSRSNRPTKNVESDPHSSPDLYPELQQDRNGVEPISKPENNPRTPLHPE